MATVGDNNPTLMDVAQRSKDGQIQRIVELLSEVNEVLADASMFEGNMATGHKTTTRSGLPAVAWRQLNAGVQPTKSRTVQVVDTIGMLEAYAEVDKSLADLNGNTAEFRMSEDRAFIQAMGQEMAGTFFYGNTEADPEEFLGLSPRYSDTTAVNGGNILLAGGSGADNTSMWLVSHGPDATYLVYPRGQKSGLQFEDLGQETLEDAAGGLFEGYRSHYKWDVGLVCRDWRQNIRIANIDVSDLTTFGAGTDNSADLIRLMIEAVNTIEMLGVGRQVFYCNRVVKTWLEIMVNEKVNVNLVHETFGGEKILAFRGIPIRLVDQLVNTETLVA